MCCLLEITRSSYYYKEVESVSEAPLEDKVKETFLENKAQFGTRKIKHLLANQGIQLSRRRIVKRLNLVCVYQKAAFKLRSKGKKEASVPNFVDREFNDHNPLEILVTDLTYVRVGVR